MIAVKGPDSKEERIEHMVTLYQLPLLRMCIMYLHDEELAKDAVHTIAISRLKQISLFIGPPEGKSCNLSFHPAYFTRTA